MDSIYQIKKNLMAGNVLLLPTDTIPGLSFDPRNKKAAQWVYSYKQRPQTKPFVHLVGSVTKAQSFWEPLPPGWPEAIKKAWPAPLTIVWKSTLVPNGSLGLRFPKLTKESQWMHTLLKDLPFPLPTTSVNFSGQEASSSWDEACKQLKETECYIPSFPNKPTCYGKASTVVKILDSKSYCILRHGTVSKKELKTIWQDFAIIETT